MDIPNHALLQAEGFVALVVVLATIPILRRFAPKLGLVDHPGGRKRQCTPTPLVGGVAVFIALLIVLLDGDLYLQYPGFTTGITSLFVIGLLDDRHDLGAELRFVAQAVIVSVALSMDGIWLESIGSYTGTQFELGILKYPITVLSVLGVINAINMLDGLDGLASGVVALTLFFILGFSIESQSSIITLSSTLLGATLGFWLYNYRFPWRTRASVFMGDSGTILLGFALPYIAINLTLPSKTTIALEPAYLLWLFALPLWDITTVLIKRVKAGRSPFLAGRDHIHHILLSHNLSVRQTVLLIYCISLLALSLGTSLHYFKFGSIGLYTIFLLTLYIYVKLVYRFEGKLMSQSAEVIDFKAATDAKKDKLNKKI
ncbi:glycosyltransferase family 4 protein [Kangiella shandongensis]|uniref:glycosyltransferase family 4 protein n=1 Tax=Kangiella shandongensis TaxID=2763258 RepID=UPI001CC06F30|nr:MraY family glycosyltransferase [Kangiella shandongensis]